MSRSISYSEIQTALTCWARHAFAYTGYLTDGATLRQRALPPILSDGRAWGAAVAQWHSGADSFTVYNALTASLNADAARQAEVGVQVPTERLVDMANRLAAVLDHYIATAERLPNLTRLEGEINVPLPARSGVRASKRYRYHGYADGFTADGDGHQWLVEFKLRESLTPAWLIQLSPQIRWYAWAIREEQGGYGPVGVLIDERLNEAPKPARLVQGKRKGELVPSHNKAQLTTPEAYENLCDEHDVEPHTDVIESLTARQWQQRVPILFRPGELDEAGRELTGVAQLIRDLDNGRLTPIRNASPQHCNGCRYREICANPQDDLYVDSLFERTVPKRLREKWKSHA